MAVSKAAKAGEKPSGPVRKSEVTRQRILDAAAKVFAERGYGHARLNDIAKEAGAHAGGIYYYFDSRDALVEEVLTRATRRSLENMQRHLDALPERASVAERLRAAATAQLSSIMKDDHYNLAYNKIFSQVPDHVRSRHRPVLRQFFAVWRDLIREGQENGEIRADLDAAVIRLTLTGSIQWAAEWATKSAGSPEQLADKMMDIFFSGIIAR